MNEWIIHQKVPKANFCQHVIHWCKYGTKPICISTKRSSSKMGLKPLESCIWFFVMILQDFTRFHEISKDFARFLYVRNFVRFITKLQNYFGLHNFIFASCESIFLVGKSVNVVPIQYIPKIPMALTWTGVKKFWARLACVGWIQIGRKFVSSEQAKNFI